MSICGVHVNYFKAEDIANSYSYDTDHPWLNKGDPKIQLEIHMVRGNVNIYELISSIIGLWLSNCRDELGKCGIVQFGNRQSAVLGNELSFRFKFSFLLYLYFHAIGLSLQF